MSNEKKKSLTAVDACKMIGKALRENVSSLKKAEKKLLPKDAGLKVTKAILQQIKEYKDSLVKMRNVEDGETLEKKTPPNVSEETMHELKGQYGSDKEGKAKAYATAWKISKEKKTKKSEAGGGLPQTPPKSSKNVFNILKGEENPEKVPEKVKLEVKEKPREKETVLPSDKDSKDISAKDTGSGGQVKKGKKLKKSESPIFNSELAKGQFKLTPMGSKLLQAGKPKFTGKDLAEGKSKLKAAGVKVQERPGLQQPTTKSAELLDKKDDKKMMQQHAAIAGSKEAKNRLMPARQQTVKMPTPQEHEQRASTFQQFTPAAKIVPEVKQAIGLPKPAPSVAPKSVFGSEMFQEFTPKGKWNKSELMKEMEAMEKEMGMAHDERVANKGKIVPDSTEKTPSSSKITKPVGDPAYDKTYSTTWETEHGRYFTRGSALGSGKIPGVSLEYLPNKSKIPGLRPAIKQLGVFPSKEHAYAARNEHHDKIMAGVAKEEQCMDKGEIKGGGAQGGGI